MKRELWQKLKEQSPDHLLIFKGRRHYRAYYDDADKLATACNIIARFSEGGVDWCRFPARDLYFHLWRLTEAGILFKVVKIGKNDERK